jgi:hypothetical protein
MHFKRESMEAVYSTTQIGKCTKVSKSGIVDARLYPRTLVAPEQYAIIDQGMLQATVASRVRPLSYKDQIGKAFQRARLELRASMAVVA